MTIKLINGSWSVETTMVVPPTASRRVSFACCRPATWALLPATRRKHAAESSLSTGTERHLPPSCHWVVGASDCTRPLSPAVWSLLVIWYRQRLLFVCSSKARLMLATRCCKLRPIIMFMDVGLNQLHVRCVFSLTSLFLLPLVTIANIICREQLYVLIVHLLCGNLVLLECIRTCIVNMYTNWKLLLYICINIVLICSLLYCCTTGILFPQKQPQTTLC